MAITVEPIPILADNYAWLLRDAATGAVAVVDPADGAAVIRVIEARGGRLDWILLTHHHLDHVAGTDAVRARFGAKVAGAAVDAHRLPRLDLALREGEQFALGDSVASVLETPGHTRGHIAFVFEGALICGDTLFSLGCGRLLEGGAAEMFASLAKFKALPGETLVCAGHEYTESNARFALSADPDNPALQALAAEAASLRRDGKPTLPVALASELAANPFLRAPDVASFAALRAAKDKF
jgi:hydroxyacylglutathione hydrolase